MVVPETANLTIIACRGSTNCEAVGGVATSTGISGGLVSVTERVPGTAVPVPGIDHYGVACTGATTCVAVGDDHPDGTYERR